MMDPPKNPIRWRALHIPAKLYEIVASLGAENKMSPGEAGAVLIQKGLLVVRAENAAKQKAEEEAKIATETPPVEDSISE